MIRCCGNCKASRLEGEQLHCRLVPPDVLFVPDVGIVSAFPTVAPAADCEQHRYSLLKLLRRGNGPRT